MTGLKRNFENNNDICKQACRKTKIEDAKVNNTNFTHGRFMNFLPILFNGCAVERTCAINRNVKGIDVVEVIRLCLLNRSRSRSFRFVQEMNWT